MEELVTLKIDDIDVTVPKGTTILQAARKAGIDIPTLCFLKEINEVGDCRMCIVEVERKAWLCNFMYYKSRRKYDCTYKYPRSCRCKKGCVRFNSFKSQNRLFNLYKKWKLRVTRTM